ncbi:MAG: isoprenoid biosynthesis glyoxalase ElbB [Acidobacteria bacterium]|nr:isoprenoid biosynthesis glyoxalase ElbB [Acidobacteriota bacterium]
MKKVAVCLSGCGVFDGAEIHEAVCTLLALDQAGAQAVCCAPDVPQAEVIDHLQQKPEAGTRNVLVESARIARGAVRPLGEIKAADVDALIFPGGFGAAKNLCDFAFKGADCTVNPDVERLVQEMLAARKPIGAICIAPALLARILGKKKLAPKLTIGTDKGTAAAINAMGGDHCECAVTEMVTDEKNRIVSTPAYMLGRGPAEVFGGIRKLVGEVLRLASA